MWTLLMWHNRFSENQSEPWRHIYRDNGIPRPKSHGIELPRPKNRDIEIRGLKHHDIEKQRCSVKKVFLENFAKFTGKHLCRDSFLIKLQAFLQNTSSGCFCLSYRLTSYASQQYNRNILMLLKLMLLKCTSIDLPHSVFQTRNSR